MKRILIDMDDVICQGGFIYHINNFLGTNYMQSDMKDYYMQDIIPKEKFEEWNIYISEQNIYKEGNAFLANAREAIEKLCRCYDVYIVTAYIFKDCKEKSGKHLFNKFEWLCKEFPFIDPYNFIFSCHKELIEGDIRIDDKLSNLEGRGETKLLFTAYHNKNITDNELLKKGVLRVNGWGDIEKLLLPEGEQK